MGDRIYKLTEVEFLQRDYEQSDCDFKSKEMPSATYTEPTPTVRSEIILSVGERAQLYYQDQKTKEVIIKS